jgi:4-amino-4-deoxychorismate lyase
MQACLALLNIPDLNWNQVRGWIDEIAISSGAGGIKLLVSRGSGGRGYSPTGVSEPKVVLSRFIYPQHYLSWQSNGVRLCVARPRLGINPLLAGHKHNNRIEQVLLKADVENQGFVDGVVLDINNHVIETTAANIFWVTAQTLYTPNMASSGVAGVLRRKVIEQAKQMKMKITMDEFTLDHLLNADEVFICNALLGIAPVITITHTALPIGKVTREFQKSTNSV